MNSLSDPALIYFNEATLEQLEIVLNAVQYMTSYNLDAWLAWADELEAVPLGSLNSWRDIRSY